jgi:4-amino-4-deoxy-L-arabinose transferase-like glycosyltransferase
MQRTQFALALRLGMLAVFLILGVIYAAATPIFEKNDEDHHFALARHLAQGGGLPVQRPGIRTPWEQEGSQPPLYYVLIAPALSLYNTADFAQQIEPNASPQYAAFAPNNKNKSIITPEKRAFAFRDSTLAAFTVRLLGLIPGAATVWLTYSLGMALTRSEPTSLLAMGLVAFNPMFITISSAVSNDVLVIAFATLGAWLLVTCLVDGATPARALALGLAIGLASLSKVSGALLLPVALIALVVKARWADRPSRTWGTAIQAAAIVGLAWLAVAGWWYARNLALYGELTGTMTMARVAGMRDPSTIEWLGELRGFRWTFLGVFGQTNVPADLPVYQLFDLFALVCAIGFALFLIGRGGTLLRQQVLAIAALAAHAILVAAGIAYWTQFTAASHGRLLFPAIASLATFAAIGLAELLHRLGAPDRLTPALILPFATLAVVVPVRYVLPAYQPPLVNIGAPGWALGIPVQRFGDLAEILAVRMSPESTRPGHTVRVQATMRALRSTDRQYRLVALLAGRDGRPLTRFETYPGGGLLPSRDWAAGDTWVETVDLAVPAGAAVPAVLAAQFSLFEPYFGEIVTSTDAAGYPAAPLFPGTTLVPASTARAGPAAAAAFGEFGAIEAITHTIATPGQSLDIALAWRANGRADRDYTVFLHLMGPDDKLWAQHDGPPDGGNYPTSRWVPGTRFEETRRLALPADMPDGEYRLMAGLYEPTSLTRAPARDADGRPARHDAVEVARVRIDQ